MVQERQVLNKIGPAFNSINTHNMFVVNHLPSRVAGTMCQIKYLFVVALVCSLFVSCEKEEASDGTIEIFAEAMSGGNGKVLLDGATATWVNGDAIRINSTEVAVERRNDRAYISYNAAEDEVTRAVYPASLAANSDLSSDYISLNFPAYYHYRTDASGHQLLELPMAARSEGNASLKFKHLTGALYVTVKNTANVPLILQSVTVASNHYQLNGTINGINLNSSGDINIIPTLSGNPSERYVSLIFDDGHTLDVNESIQVMLPVLPVGGATNTPNDFTIKVKTSSTNNQNLYLHSQSQTSGADHTLARNELGYATTEITITDNTPTPTLDQEGSHYVVRTPFDFKLMTENITSGDITGDAYIDILADLDMTDIPVTTVNNSHFSGTLDGHNHIINNLTINSRDLGTTGYCCALFSTSVTIKDISINNLSLIHQRNSDKRVALAGLIGTYSTSQEGTLNINNCNITYNAINISGATGPIYFGGLLCEIDSPTSNISISNCSVNTSNVILSGRSYYWGGLIASAGSSSTTITNSSWSGNTNLTSTTNIRAGGLIGNKAQGNLTITGCNVNGSFIINSNGQYNYLASLIGRYAPIGSNTVTIDNNVIDVDITLNNTPINPVPQYNN